LGPFALSLSKGERARIQPGPRRPWFDRLTTNGFLAGRRLASEAVQAVPREHCRPVTLNPFVLNLSRDE